jgi:hypothetical protein
VGAAAAADAARGATAGLIIAFPVFLLLTRALGREIAREPEKRGSKVRKWLTYLTLFVAAMVLIGDLTFLVSRLLAGEIPTRVLLKVAVVFVIAGTVFGHYLGELRRDDTDGAAPARELRVPPRLAAAGVVVVLVAGLVLGGSPRRERQRQTDDQRARDLQSVSTLVRQHVDEYGTLPSSLAPIMSRPDAYSTRFLDPVSREPYGYRVLDSLRYELCATFDATDSTGSEGGVPFWWHGPGRTCFTFHVPPRALLEAEKATLRRPPVVAPRPERGP